MRILSLSSMNLRFLACVSLILFLCAPGEAQLGSIQSFDFLNLSPSARTAALGGSPIALSDGDINIAHINPASINESTEHLLALNHNFHLADISFGNASYGFHSSKLNTSFLAAFQFINYGDFVRTNEVGEVNGTFHARENVLVIGMSRMLNERISGGLHLKTITSSFDGYNAFGLAFDFGLNYHKPGALHQYSLVIRNAGVQLAAYDLQKESLPLDIQIGFSKRLQYVPFRFFITFHHLNQWDLSNDFSLDDDPLFFDQPRSEPGSFSQAADNLFRHLRLGGEISIGANEQVRLRIGYDHQQKKDLSVPGYRAFSGLRMGLGIKIKALQLDYAFGRNHLSGGVNHLSLILHLKDVFSKL